MPQLTQAEIESLQERLKVVEKRMAAEMKGLTKNEMANYISNLDNKVRAEGDDNRNRKADGAEIRAEFTKVKLDSDKDGKVDVQGIKDAMMRLADHDKDGKMSKFEAMTLAASMNDRGSAASMNIALSAIQKTNPETKVAYDLARVELLEQALGIGEKKEEGEQPMVKPRQTPPAAKGTEPSKTQMMP